MTSLGSDKSTTLSMVGSSDIDLVTMNEVIQDKRSEQSKKLHLESSCSSRLGDRSSNTSWQNSAMIAKKKREKKEVGEAKAGERFSASRCNFYTTSSSSSSSRAVSCRVALFQHLPAQYQFSSSHCAAVVANTASEEQSTTELASKETPVPLRYRLTPH